MSGRLVYLQHKQNNCLGGGGQVAGGIGGGKEQPCILVNQVIHWQWPISKFKPLSSKFLACTPADVFSQYRYAENRAL